MVMLLLGRLPDTADSVEWEGWRFEVVDLDGKRVDKVLATALVADPTGAPSCTVPRRRYTAARLRWIRPFIAAARSCR